MRLFESNFLNVGGTKKDTLSWPGNLYHNEAEDATVGFLTSRMSPVFMSLSLRLSVTKLFRYLGGLNDFDKRFRIIFPLVDESLCWGVTLLHSF